MTGTATSLVEVWHSRKVRSATKAKESTTEIAYLVIGTTDLSHDTAEAYAKTEGPNVDQDLVRQSIDLDEIRPGYFRAVFRFAHPDNEQAQEEQQPEDASEFSFDTSGNTTHIQVSLNTSSYGVGEETPPEFSGAIKVTDGDSVEGADIVVPTFRYSETKVFTAAQMTVAFAKTISELTGCTNNATFKGWAAGEVLFLGAQGSRKAGGDWTVTFSFLMEKNQTNLDIGDVLNIDKQGHQYLWVRMSPKDDETAKQRVRRPTAVYVETVYEPADFSGLGIGT